MTYSITSHPLKIHTTIAFGYRSLFFFSKPLIFDDSRISQRETTSKLSSRTFIAYILSHTFSFSLFFTYTFALASPCAFLYASVRHHGLCPAFAPYNIPVYNTYLNNLAENADTVDPKVATMFHPANASG